MNVFSRRRSLLAVLAVAVIAIFAAFDFADARSGSGKSSGSRGSRTYNSPAPTRTAPNAAPLERSMTQQGPSMQRGPVQAPGRTGGFFNRPGLLGGLAAGFLGAGLLGLLFGNGLAGGLGGLASIMGLVLQLGLIALVAGLLWMWWQRRSQPAVAGPAGNVLRRETMADLGSRAPLGGGGSGVGPRPAAPSDEVGIGRPDYDAFERLLTEIQAAYSNEDLAGLRTRVTPEMLSYFSEELAEASSRGIINRVSNVQLRQGDLAEAWREDGAEFATVAMRFSLVDQTLDRATGRVVDGSASPQEVTEIWTFRRARAGSWVLSAIQQA